jgi:hypothetical protein
VSDFPSVGAEEEFLLVDPRTGEPAPLNHAGAAEAERCGVTLQLELSSCQVETTSSVATTSAELGEELTRLRRAAAQAGEASGARLLALGLPPATPHEFPVTDTPRYRRIGEQFGVIESWPSCATGASTMCWWWSVTGSKACRTRSGRLFPHAVVQTCIVHLRRGSFRHASRKDWPALAKDLKPVHTAPSESAALDRFAGIQ